MLVWLAMAHAHGPAPAALEVLAWSAESVCDEAVHAPAIVRTSIGLGTRAADAYVYGCPARWGEAETALAASDGTRVLLAGSARVFVSEDGGCSTRELPIPANDTPVAVAFGDQGWLVTRDFVADRGALWRLDDTLVEVARWDDFWPDGLLVDGTDVWLSGARPTPRVVVWRGARGADLPLPEAVDGLQRLAPRQLHEGALWLQATDAAGRWLWRVAEDAAEMRVGPAQVLHGPAWFGGTALATLDGTLWRDVGEGFVATPTAVDWTCLDALEGVPYACGLFAMRALVDDLGGTVPIFSIDQLAPPDPACDTVEGACDQDWLHFGGESGLVDTVAAACPLDPRGPLPEVPVAPEGCGCATGGGAVGLAPLVLLWRRRRRAQRTRSAQQVV